jgi:polar amino acid transport system ATP-binding protein
LNAIGARVHERTNLSMIRVRNLHKRFGSSHVLRGVDLDIARGEVFVIIGRSGSGKSTLLRCLNFLVEYDEGEVSFNDVLVGYRRRPNGSLVRDTESSINQLRAQMGMVCQSFNLFPHMSVLENVIEGPVFVRHIARREAVVMAEELLAKVGLADKAAAYPSTLSGGQQQRAAIARALAMEPKAILFDEPTSALDPELVGEVLDVMQKLAAEGMTMVIVTHEMSFAREAADRVMMLEEGIALEVGPPEQLFKAPIQARTAEFLRRVQR